MIWYPDYPTVAEITASLQSQGVPSPINVALNRAQAIVDFEEYTGFDPFLGDTTEKDWPFDAPQTGDSILDFLGGFWAISAVKVGVTYGSTGTTLVQDQDYQLLPLSAANEGRGWDQLRFLNISPSGPGSILITGKRGFAQQLPADVYKAIFDQASFASYLDTQKGPGIASSTRQGPVELKFETTGGAQKGVVWAKSYARAIAKYARI